MELIICRRAVEVDYTLALGPTRADSRPTAAGGKAFARLSGTVFLFFGFLFLFLYYSRNPGAKQHVNAEADIPNPRFRALKQFDDIRSATVTAFGGRRSKCHIVGETFFESTLLFSSRFAIPTPPLRPESCCEV